MDLFQSWIGKSKLGIAYLLYTNNLKCDTFLSKVIKHLASNLETLKPEEFVAMLLMVYFKKNMSADDIMEYMDPTLLQMILADFLQDDVLSSGEICAVTLGLGKLRDFRVNYDELRVALYEKMGKIVEQMDAER